MATTLYPTTTASTQNSSTWGANGVKLVLAFARGSGVTTQTDNTLASLTTGGTGAVHQVGGTASVATASITFPQSINSTALVWITEPLNAVTISSNITVNQRALETNAMANYACYAIVGKVPSGGGANAVIGLKNMQAELGTTEAGSSMVVVPNASAGTLSAGDMLFLILCYAGPSVSTASGYTASTFYAGTASAASGDSFVTFAETITPAVAAAYSLLPAPTPLQASALYRM